MGAESKMPRWGWGVGTALALLATSALYGVEMEASAGTQQCNTECQSKMTDCILACDGMRSCEETCKKKGQSCVSVCTSDAGLAPALEAVDAADDAASDRATRDARSVTPKDAAVSRVAPRDR